MTRAFKPAVPGTRWAVGLGGAGEELRITPGQAGEVQIEVRAFGVPLMTRVLELSVAAHLRDCLARAVDDTVKAGGPAL